MSYEAPPSTAPAPETYGDETRPQVVVVRRGHSRITALPPQPWQRISGLLPEKEPTLTRSERRHALRKLFRHYEQLVRDALVEHDADPEKDERTLFWDPLQVICIELGIARRKLTALVRELTGMSATDVIDRLRAQTLRERMEKDIAGLLGARVAVGKATLREGFPNWASRLFYSFDGARSRSFDTTAWAVQYGFANFYRFRRGCMLAHAGRSPRQLQSDVIGDLAQWYAAADAVKRRKQMIEANDYHYEIKQHAGTAYSDDWARLHAERPEWCQRMQTLLGLPEELQPFAAWTHVPALDEAARLHQAALAKRGG